jgi:cation transport ATPase
MMTIQNDSYPRAYFNDEPELVVPATEKDKVSILSKPKARKRKIKTAIESAQSKAENRKLEMYAKQESKRAAKVQVDQKIVLWAWIVGIGIAFISSAIVSFNGITSVAFFVGLSQDWMAGLFFFFVEIMYLLFLVAYLILSSRIDENGNPEKTLGSILGMIAFGGIAVLANAFHTLDYWGWDNLEPRMWAGLILSISAPIAIISASKMASRVVFAKAIKL